MGTRKTATAESLRDAVAQVVADLIDWDPGDVNVMIQAKDFEDDREVELTVTFVDVEGEAPPRARREEAEEEGPEEEAAEEPSEEEATAGTPESVDAELDEEAEAAADFVEGILDILELPGDIKIRLFEDHAEVEVVDSEGGVLIGRRGSTLESIQELLRCSLQREFQRRSRVMVDVEGYRARRLEKLEEKAEEAVEDVLATGDSQRLEPMDVFERKAMHNLVSSYEGVTSRSQGREPSRRVVIG